MHNLILHGRSVKRRKAALSVLSPAGGRPTDMAVAESQKLFSAKLCFACHVVLLEGSCCPSVPAVRSIRLAQVIGSKSAARLMSYWGPSEGL